MRILLVALSLLCVSATAAERPNVLFISFDDLNDWIEPLGGHPQAKTPNLSRLARQATLFTHAYTAAPACNPSRAALMTGIAPYKSGVYYNNQAWRPAMPDAVTLPQYFMKNGYWAGAAGKIYHGVYPDPPSWNEYWPSQQKNKPDDPKPAKLPANGIPNTGNFDWGGMPIDVEEMGDAQVANWVAAKLKEKHDKPFFLAFGIYRPHLPWHVPQRYLDRFPLDSIQVPPVFNDDLKDVPAAGVKMANPTKDHANVIEHGQWKQAVQAYLASTNFADDMLGRVLDALEESGQADNTIIVMWTDHGWHLGEKHHWRKFALWEEATKTPLMFVAPKGTPGLAEGTRAGARSDRTVNLLDIYPTLLELAGLPANAINDGRSLIPLLRNPDAPWQPTVTTYGRNNHAIRSDDMRYIRYADGSEELYDHRVDAMEWTNLAADSNYADVKRNLRQWFPKVNVPGAPRQSANRRTNTVAIPE